MMLQTAEVTESDVLILLDLAYVTTNAELFNDFHVQISDPVGILGVLVVLLALAKQGEVVIPLFVCCPLVDNDRIIGVQQENSHYSQCFIHPPSSTTISSYWVTPQHTNKTLSSNHQAPTYTPNPPTHSVTGTPFFLLSYPTPLELSPLMHPCPSPSPCSTTAAWKHTG